MAKKEYFDGKFAWFLKPVRCIPVDREAHDGVAKNQALEVLENVDIIYCEDTRNTVRLLNHYNIKSNLKSYHEHNENSRKEEILSKLEKGLNIEIVSDAGMPGISDPGHIIIRYFYRFF